MSLEDFQTFEHPEPSLRVLSETSHKKQDKISTFMSGHSVFPTYIRVLFITFGMLFVYLKLQSTHFLSAAFVSTGIESGSQIIRRNSDISRGYMVSQLKLLLFCGITRPSVDIEYRLINIQGVP